MTTAFIVCKPSANQNPLALIKLFLENRRWLEQVEKCGVGWVGRAFQMERL